MAAVCRPAFGSPATEGGGMPVGLRITLAITIFALMTATDLSAQQGCQPPPSAGTQAQPASAGGGQPPANTPQMPQSPANETGTGQEQAPAAPSTDTRPLAGAQAITPSLPSAGRSFIIPSLSIWEGADTNAILNPGYSHLEVAAIPLASLDLHVLGRHNTFDLNYGGGGIAYQTAWNNSSLFDDFQISDEYAARRWNLFIADRGTYLPQASAGFGGIGFAGVFDNVQSLGLGSGASELNPAYVPEASILTGRFGLASETGMAQVQYFLTPRTSATAMGSFGYQYYTQSGLLSGSDRYGVLSLDHQVTPTETVSFAYSITEFRYSGGSVAVSDNLWRIGYGHRIANHLTLSLLAGPELTYSAVRGVFGVKQRLSWAGQGELGYRVQRGSVSLFYLHYLTPGSGVFQGAQTSVARVTVTRELSRTWTSDLSVGWTTNTALTTYSLNPFFLNVGGFDTEFGTLRVSHNIGRSLRAFGVYGLEREQSGSPFLAGSTNTLLVRHIFGVGLEWHPRPFGL